ncbi:DgyrCDS13662 [Dimorphilus gyrociliatus]|uniref:DgyrCDS13662 n=1 Tax=Dimorphilus gyrociliatus TaxID=2664684 RepID=A0A7I8WBD9_9ANNE|nr:DgyrCDS13662 [Dimorphilus gyrociliatus]
MSNNNEKVLKFDPTDEQLDKFLAELDKNFMQTIELIRQKRQEIAQLYIEMDHMETTLRDLDQKVHGTVCNGQERSL